MPRDLILGTAGHIDHGKTSLVKALTGIDCDRLPEEKQRGITIDIGFAHLELGELRFGIVDVPGHERFIRNMLAGATGIDLALLVIAADDGVMPQTREHLEILQLLNIRHAVIALTKADLVDETTRDVRILEIQELLQSTLFRDAAIVPISARTGIGLDELKQTLAEVGQRVETERGSEWFRMCIDRAFTVQGHGTVVTGSVISGSVRVGDELEWQPRGERVRVRSLNNHGHPVEEAHRGQRAALNLAGVSLEDVQRGQELAMTGYLIPSRILTVRLHALNDRRHTLKHRLPVRLHLGTAETMATLSLLDCESIEAGQWGLGQLFLDDPVCAVWGQPFVVRDSSAEHTMGGGQVLQSTPSKLRRRHIESIERVELLWSSDAEQRAHSAAWFAGFDGFGVAELVRGAGLRPDQTEAMLRSDQFISLPRSNRLLHIDRAKEIEHRLMDVLQQMHESNPLMTAQDRQKVQSQLDYLGNPAMVSSVVDRLLITKRLTGDLKRIARADFKPKLTANQRKLKDKIAIQHQKSGFQPPDMESYASQPGGQGNVHDLFDVCVAEGYLVAMSGDVFLHVDVEVELRRILTERMQGGVGLTVAEIRDLLGTTRKYAVPICEYIDRVGLTRRDGDLRFLV